MGLLQTVRFSVRTARLGLAPRLAPAKIDRLARRRLNDLVRFASAHSSFYRNKYRKINFDRFTLDQLPITTKQELLTNFDESLTDPLVGRRDIEHFLGDPRNLGRWFRRKYSVSHTSVSQGPPLPIVQDRRSLEILFGIMSARANSNGSPGVLEGLRRLREPARVAIIAQRRGFYPSGAAFEFMRELVGPFVRVEWLSAVQPDLIERLNAFQPHVLVGYASVLEALALQTDRLHLNHLRQISNSSEQLTARARQRIEAAYQVRILDHYGTGECLFLSDGCPTDGGAHVNADWAILEVVDEQYRPVPPGEVGKKVLITNLANRIQPFIRYEVGDRLMMAAGACRCGSRLPWIERIEGRSAELFWIEKAGGYAMLPGVLFHTAIDSLHEVREWQAIQTERNRVEIRLELLSGVFRPLEGLSRVLKQRLREFGLANNVQVDVRVVLSLPPDPHTGKFRRMISEIGAPTEIRQREHALAS